MRHHAQAFSQALIIPSYEQQEVNFCKCVKSVPMSDVPAAAMVIRSHVIYKIKHNNDKMFFPKASLRLMGVRTNRSISSRLRAVHVCLRMSDLSSLLPHSSSVISRRQMSSLHSFRSDKLRAMYLWFRLTRAPITLTTGCFWPPPMVWWTVKRSGKTSRTVCFTISVCCSYLSCRSFFPARCESGIVILVAKIVHDVFIIGEPTHVQCFLAAFNLKVSFGTVTHGPGSTRLQHECGQEHRHDTFYEGRWKALWASALPVYASTSSWIWPAYRRSWTQFDYVDQIFN